MKDRWKLRKEQTQVENKQVNEEWIGGTRARFEKNKTKFDKET